MKNRALIAWLGVLCVFGGVMTIGFASGLWSQDRDKSPDLHQAASENDDASSLAGSSPRLESFQLTDQEKKVFDSKSLAGKIWVGSIFFADCPSTCRTQNQRVAELQLEFGDDGVEFVSITCDPEHDTPTRLAEYSRLFSAKPEKWHFLTGDLDLIKRIGSEILGITVDEQVHSDRLVVFDREGKVQGAYRSTDRDEFLKAKAAIKALLETSTVES